MRAVHPRREGWAESHGVPVAWQEYGDGAATVLFLPPWQITHARIYKMQVAYLARYFRVVTYDPPGNGRSGRPATGYDFDRAAADARAVMDVTETARASLVAKSRGAWTGVLLAAEHPDRVDRLVLVAPALEERVRDDGRFHARRDRHDGWDRFNAHYWREHYADFVQFFFREATHEPHSTKVLDDGLAWGLETTPEILIATVDEAGCRTALADLLAAVRVPTLVIHGTADRIRPFAIGERVHQAIAGSRLVAFEEVGHMPGLRHPVQTNLVLREFLAPAAPPRRTWRRALARPRRALFLSSPIGLGHALRVRADRARAASPRPVRRGHADGLP